MKNIVWIFILSLITFAGFGQITMVGSSYSKSIDTVFVAGATEYLTTPSGDLNSRTTGIVDIELKHVSDSGTVSVTAVLQSSIDGATWSGHFKTIGTNGINCDTLTYTGTKHHIWHVEPGAVKYVSFGDSASYSLGGSASYPTNSASGRRLHFRVMLIVAAGTRSSYSGKLLWTNTH